MTLLPGDDKHDPLAFGTSYESKNEVGTFFNLTRAQTSRVPLVENARHALPPVSAPKPKHPSTHTRSLAQSICIPGFEIGGAVEHEEEEGTTTFYDDARARGGGRRKETGEEGRKKGRQFSSAVSQRHTQPHCPRKDLADTALFLQRPRRVKDTGEETEEILLSLLLYYNKRAMALYTCVDKGNKSVTGFWQPLRPLQPPNSLRYQI